MNYELSFISKNISPTEKEKLVSAIEKEIKDLGGTIEEKFSEKKKFAYPVKKEKDGYLVIFSFDLAPQKIKNLKKGIKLNKEVLREMIEKRPKKKEEKHRRTKTKPEKEYETKKPVIKKKKVKIEDLDEKLEEILK